MRLFTSQKSQSYLQWCISNELQHRGEGILLLIFLALSLTHCLVNPLYSASATATTANVAISSNALQATAIVMPCQSVGIDAATIDSLPKFSYNSSAGDHCTIRNVECSICLGEFQDKELVNVMPMCYYGYHSECLDKWLRLLSTCPLCRASLPVGSPTQLANP
ncbi:Zinc finger, RING-type [Dillenia turbinata]|uniref:Zinc finger, RING-type n=1 Tax=Dillenia turbinata TaxID=194707 RepID=A0AAN8ZIP8_9MAGN